MSSTRTESDPRNEKEWSRKDYQRLRLLGTGSQGRVYLVRNKHTGDLFAMKQVPKGIVAAHQKALEALASERNLLAIADHPLITTLYHCFHDDKWVYFVMEACLGNEFFDLLNEQPYGRLAEADLRFYAAEILLALEYVHALGFVYRDLKPENILLQDNGHIRLADFGLCKQAEDDTLGVTITAAAADNIRVSTTVLTRANSFVGTRNYMAPETVEGKGTDSIADWWSYGVLLFDVVCGLPPFTGSNPHKVMRRILSGEFVFPLDVELSMELCDLIRQLLVVDPTQRLGYENGAADIKAHPWFKGVTWALVPNDVPPFVPTALDVEDEDEWDEFDDEEIEVIVEGTAETGLGSSGKEDTVKADKDDGKAELRSRRIASSSITAVLIQDLENAEKEWIEVEKMKEMEEADADEEQEDPFDKFDFHIEAIRYTTPSVPTQSLDHLRSQSVSSDSFRMGDDEEGEGEEGEESAT